MVRASIIRVVDQALQLDNTVELKVPLLKECIAHKVVSITHLAQKWETLVKAALHREHREISKYILEI